MENIKSKIKKALSIAEMLVALSIVGIMGAIFATMASDSNVSDKKIKIASQNFYTAASKYYMQIISPLGNNYRITKGDSESLLNEFLNYFDLVGGEIKEGSELNITDSGAKCAKLANGITMGVYLDTTCKTEVVAYEYLKDDDVEIPFQDRATRTVNGACGYIKYRTKNSSGTFRQDEFVIPLGKDMFK
jgi:hypothetical protein